MAPDFAPHGVADGYADFRDDRGIAPVRFDDTESDEPESIPTESDEAAPDSADQPAEDESDGEDGPALAPRPQPPSWTDTPAPTHSPDLLPEPSEPYYPDMPELALPPCQDDCGCCNGCECCDCCGVPIYFRADAMFLARTRGNDQSFATVGPNGHRVLNIADKDFSVKPVTQLVIGSEFCTGYAMEVAFYGLNHWTMHNSVVDPTNNLYSPFSQFGTNPAAGFADSDRASRASTEYASNLYNLEANFFFRRYQSCNWGDVRLMTGVRHFHLSEGFNYNTVTAVDTASTQVRTQNELFGWQCGGRWHIPLACWMHFNVDLKTGVYGNDASVETISSAAQNGVFREGARRRQAVFLTDIAPVLQFDVNEHFSIRLGYYLTYINGLALAPNNFNATPPPGNAARAARISSGGSTAYHGFTAGLEWRY
ncbi:MAG: hypothetical protein AB7O62_06515 [Pirellulales bacterium]